MNKKNTAASSALAALRDLISLSDDQFAEEYLAELSEEELADFRKECPDFPDTPPSHVSKSSDQP